MHFLYQTAVGVKCGNCSPEQMKNCLSEFYVLLTVHLGSTLVNNQLDAQFFVIHIYSNSLHVSSTPVLIIRKINCN